MAKPYLDSNELLATVKRNISFPLSQQTFSDEDILSFANQEMFGVQVPTILEVHEDYFTFSEDVTVKMNKSRYDIPYRAIGLKINNLYWGTSHVYPENINKMTLIQNTEKAMYGGTTDGAGNCNFYYIEANQICLTPNIGAQVYDTFLRFTYYLRPNNLVVNERAAICQNFTRDVTVTNSLLVPGDVLTIGDVQFIADTDFAIGATDLATATNLNVAINTNANLSSRITANIVSVMIDSTQTVVSSSNQFGLNVEDAIGIDFDQVPENITNSSLVDFLKVKGGHRTYKIDVKLGKNVVGSTAIKFPMGVIPEEFEAGDYICSQFECIIPQIPSDLHNILAERTAARILEALGDTIGLQTANAKIGQLEARQNTLIDSRVDGSPRKVVNNNSLLRRGKNFNIY